MCSCRHLPAVLSRPESVTTCLHVALQKPPRGSEPAFTFTTGTLTPTSLGAPYQSLSVTRPLPPYQSLSVTRSLPAPGSLPRCVRSVASRWPEAHGTQSWQAWSQTWWPCPGSQRATDLLSLTNMVNMVIEAPPWGFVAALLGFMMASRA